MSDYCPTCGSPVKVVGGETKRYEPLDAATFNAELEAERRRADRAEEARENANVATLRAETDKRLLEHRLRDEIAWLRLHGRRERAKVLAGWIGVEL